ncbi:MAG: hypothetical protein ACK4TA_16790 [Saprospiraceae bacterium]
MPWTLENIEAMLVAGDTTAALEALALLIGSRSSLEKEEFQWLSARYNGLLKLVGKGGLSETEQAQILSTLHARLAALLHAMEEKPATPIPTAISVDSDEAITLTFISSKRNIRSSFKTSPHRTVGALKEALIRQFNIDITVPPDYDNPAAYLVVNKTLLTNDRLSLLEAGIKDKDIIQIDVQYHIRMVWNQAVPTRLLVTFVGRTFVKPRVIVNNVLIAKPISLTDHELEIEFYTYNFTESIKDLLFNFRFLDVNACLEFQEVVNARGKTIDLSKLQRLVPYTKEK